MNADTALRLARGICPAVSRERRFEEWQADAAGCAECGVSSASVVVGAIRLAAEARAHLLVSQGARLLASFSTIVIGAVVGAVCGAFGIPVLIVIAIALLLQGSTIASERWRIRTRQLRSRQVETGQ